MNARRGKLRVVLVLGVLVFLLSAAEVTLWATDLVPDPRDFTLRRMTGSVQQDTSGRYVVHDARAFTTAPSFRHSPAHAGRDATGSWPFRGRPGTPLPPAASVPRVLVVGDSCVYGAGLDACDSLGWRLARELDARGLPPDRVAVIPLGVPGYSTEQIRLLLAQGLRDLRPAAVVLYVAAWNDQAPALRAPDRQILAQLADPSALDWLRTHTRLGAALLHVRDRMPADEITAAWKAGNPPLGFRVPADDVEPNVRGLIADCVAVGALPVVIAPAHPEATVRDHPRTALDSRAVLHAAAAAGVPSIDGQAALAAAGGDPSRWFNDYVHPSAEAVAVLARAAAEPVAAVLADVFNAPEYSGCEGDPIRIASIEPAEAFALGDVLLRVRLEHWTPGPAPPVVLVGGAPLLDVRVTGENEIEGTLPENGAGVQDLVVQDGLSCSVLRAGFTLKDPTIQLLAGTPARLVVEARPGDRLRLLFATSLREVPAWSAKGAARLAEDAQALPQELTCDLEGRALLEVPSLPEGRVFVQALWAPAGEDPGGLAARWTGVVELGD